MKKTQRRPGGHSGGKLNDHTLTHMRAVIAPSIDLNRQLRRNEELRDDDALLQAAQEKRDRRAARRASKLKTNQGENHV